MTARSRRCQASCRSPATRRRGRRAPASRSATCCPARPPRSACPARCSSAPTPARASSSTSRCWKRRWRSCPGRSPTTPSPAIASNCPATRRSAARPTANLFKAGDGHLLLAVNNEKQYQALMTALGRADVLDDPRFADWFARQENEPALRAIIEDALATKDPREWEKILERGRRALRQHLADRGGHRSSADRGARRHAGDRDALWPAALCRQRLPARPWRRQARPMAPPRRRTPMRCWAQSAMTPGRSRICTPKRWFEGRHCERSEAIHTSSVQIGIASSLRSSQRWGGRPPTASMCQTGVVDLPKDIDWSNIPANKEFFTNGGWKQYDVIILILVFFIHLLN